MLLVAALLGAPRSLGAVGEVVAATSAGPPATTPPIDPSSRLGVAIEEVQAAAQQEFGKRFGCVRVDGARALLVVPYRSDVLRARRMVRRLLVADLIRVYRASPEESAAAGVTVQRELSAAVGTANPDVTVTAAAPQARTQCWRVDVAISSASPAWVVEAVDSERRMLRDASHVTVRTVDPRPSAPVVPLP